MNYNNKCRQDFKLNKSSCIAWYLISSYGYYKLDESLLSDDVFDNICKYMEANWDNLTHRLKKYVDRESLSAGTGYNIEFNMLPEGFLRVIMNLVNKLGEMK